MGISNGPTETGYRHTPGARYPVCTMLEECRRNLISHRFGSDGFDSRAGMVTYMVASQWMLKSMVWCIQLQIVQPTDQFIVGQAIAQNVEVAVKIVTGASALDYDASFTGEVKAIDKLLSPVSQTEAGTVRCVGLNYKEHAAEMKLALPNTPTLVNLLLLSTFANSCAGSF
jgi:hypothetical protein